MSQAVDNMHGWADTLVKARVEDDMLVDEDGNQITFLALQQDTGGSKYLLLTTGGPHLEMYRTGRARQYRLMGFAAGEPRCTMIVEMERNAAQYVDEEFMYGRVYRRGLVPTPLT